MDGCSVFARKCVFCLRLFSNVLLWNGYFIELIHSADRRKYRCLFWLCFLYANTRLLYKHKFTIESDINLYRNWSIPREMLLFSIFGVSVIRAAAAAAAVFLFHSFFLYLTLCIRFEKEPFMIYLQWFRLGGRA